MLMVTTPHACPHCSYPLGERPGAGICPGCGRLYSIQSPPTLSEPVSPFPAFLWSLALVVASIGLWWADTHWSGGRWLLAAQIGIGLGMTCLIVASLVTLLASARNAGPTNAVSTALVVAQYTAQGFALLAIAVLVLLGLDYAAYQWLAHIKG